MGLRPPRRVDGQLEPRAGRPAPQSHRPPAMSEFAHIIKVRVLHKDDHWLRLWFEDGAIIDVDVWPLISWGEAFEHVRSSRALFEEVRADGWTIVWPGNVDLSPDM